MNKANEPAFPASIAVGPSGLTSTSFHEGIGGLTKLEYFAGLAMQGDLASQSEDTGIFNHHDPMCDYHNRAKVWKNAAKALIAALEKEQ